LDMSTSAAAHSLAHTVALFGTVATEFLSVAKLRSAQARAASDATVL
jgi:hypothetical protein